MRIPRILRTRRVQQPVLHGERSSVVFQPFKELGVAELLLAVNKVDDVRAHRSDQVRGREGRTGRIGTADTKLTHIA